MVSGSSPFARAETRYRQLLYQLHNGQLSQSDFDSAQASCAVTDTLGRSWFPAPEAGRWLLWDGQRYAPSVVQPVLTSGSARTGNPRAAAPAFQDAFAGRRGSPLAPLIALAVVLLGATAVIWFSPLSVRWGLRQSAAQKMFSESDRAAALDIAAEMSELRPATGVFYYVLPVKGSGDKVLYLVADASLGFDGIEAAGTEYGPLGYLVQLAERPAVASENITRIALDYRDADGRQIGIITARTSDILAFGSGELSYEAFLERTDGRVRTINLLLGVRE